MDAKTRKVQLKVHGRVQGVFYRQSTRARALALGLRGWVRNEPDGTVLIEASGGRTELESLVSWCKQGPPSASVSNLEIQWFEPSDDDLPPSFQVR